MMNLKWISISLAALSLSACVSVLPEPEAPDALYSVDANAAHAGLTHNIIVREPEAARLIAGQGMVSERVDGGLRLIAGAEWAGPATRQIQFAMIESFATGEAANAVAPELGIFTDYELASRLSHLQMQGERAVCEMTVSVIASSDRSLLARTVISADATATSQSATARAQALKSAASECAEQASLFAIATLRDAS
ncbi:MAG: ABC-type transport auxiliary lipoprotein family protein [Pseudomonadota bacterium]